MVVYAHKLQSCLLNGIDTTNHINENKNFSDTKVGDGLARNECTKKTFDGSNIRTVALASTSFSSTLKKCTKAS